MHKGREVQDNVFKSRGVRDFGGSGFHRIMTMPSFFGGRDPFDDPFFTDPFDNMWSPSSASSRSMLKTNREKGVVIKELDSDDEGVDNFNEKIYRSPMEPFVEHPDDDVDDVEMQTNGVTYENDHRKSEEPSKSHNCNMSFKTSRVTYGGISGAYYTSTRTRKTGSDGMVIEESKEADTSRGEATHRITRGVHDKGHSVLRKFDSDGKVNTTQMLHNLNEDELARFEETWKGNNRGRLPDYDVHRKKDFRLGEINKHKVWSLPFLEQDSKARGFASNFEKGNSSEGRAKKIVRVNIE
ncbi:unnamed protein product [Vicia faba]|uniref:Myeloid leukemia factor 1 n=1 Tax=Vicia faba TaxID=3906 RepID=A0AAV0ZT19_VICFA|nr:unnamed protein product [Vicia faba]